MFRPRIRWGVGRRALALLGAACITAISLVTPDAHAQMFSPWSVMEDTNTPTLGARNVREYSKLLDLNADQAAAAEELLAGYEREFRLISKRMQEISKSIQEEYDNDEEIDVWREVWPKVIKNYMKKSEKLSKTFMDDLKSLLDNKQLALWPQVERLHRRQTTLRMGSRAGEQIDLIELVDGMRLDEGSLTSASSLLDQYAGALDRELAARNSFFETNLDKFFDLWLNWDEEKIGALYKDLNSLSQKIVDVNRSYATQIQASLPADKQSEFDLKVKRANFPRVYRKTFAGRVLDIAEKIGDLDPTQKEGIKGLRETFERESAGINDRWAVALGEQEEKHQQNFNPWGWGGEEDPKIAEARKQRKDLEKKTVDSVKAILTEEQRQKLPDRKWKPEFDLDSPSPAH